MFFKKTYDFKKTYVFPKNIRFLKNMFFHVPKGPLSYSVVLQKKEKRENILGAVHCLSLTVMLPSSCA